MLYYYQDKTKGAIDVIKVIVKETGAKETLSITSQDGIDYIKDFIGNYGAFNDGQFEHDDEQGAYLCNQDTFNWWSKVVNDNQALEDRIAALKEIHGSDAVGEVVANASNVDLEDLAASVNAALDEAFSGDAQ